MRVTISVRSKINSPVADSSSSLPNSVRVTICYVQNSPDAGSSSSLPNSVRVTIC